MGPPSPFDFIKWGPRRGFDILGGNEFRLRQGFGFAKTLVRGTPRVPSVTGPSEIARDWMQAFKELSVWIWFRKKLETHLEN